MAKNKDLFRNFSDYSGCKTLEELRGHIALNSRIGFSLVSSLVSVQ